MALISAHLNAESFWWWQCNVTNITNVTAPPPTNRYLSGDMKQPKGATEI